MLAPHNQLVKDFDSVPVTADHPVQGACFCDGGLATQKLVPCTATQKFTGKQTKCEVVMWSAVFECQGSELKSAKHEKRWQFSVKLGKSKFVFKAADSAQRDQLFEL